MATSCAPLSAVSACSAAPVPRPPQPTRPTLIVLLPAAWTMGTTRPLEARAAAPATVEPLRNSRREAVVGENEEVAVRVMGRGWSVTVGSPGLDCQIQIFRLPDLIPDVHSEGLERIAEKAGSRAGISLRTHRI